MSQPEQPQVTLQQAIELAIAHTNAGRIADAESVYRDILNQMPDQPIALHLYGCLAIQAGNLPAAEQLIRRSIEVEPTVAQRHNDLGVVMKIAGRQEDAVRAFKEALRIDPDNLDALANLSATIGDTGALEEALVLAKRAAELDPTRSVAWNNIGKALQQLGRIDEAVAAYRRAVETTDHPAHVRSNLLLAMHYLAKVDPAAMFEEHRAFGRQMSFVIKPRTNHPHSRDPDRRLRIGYVSGDFRRHSVGYFIEAAIEKHDRANFELYCYSDVDVPDELTRRIRESATAWRDTRGLPHDAFEPMIRQDQIDILVDLVGHTGSGRLAVFAAKPAPVQVNYLGYPDTTGMSAMDYRLTDSFADPPGDADRFHAEKLIRLDPCAWCYRPPEPHPPVATRDPGEPITFGTFNALAKINEPLVAMWCEILRLVPESRFLIKTGGFAAPSAVERVRQQFIAHGIAAERVELLGHEIDPMRHLGTYGRVDLALDTFPYNGTTTTCEAMWMGVPVVTLAGRTHAGRVGVSLLENVRLRELIAPDREPYVRIAVELAQDRKRLAELRAGLRARMLASPLMNGFDFARRLESAYRTMWRAWCGIGS